MNARSSAPLSWLQPAILIGSLAPFAAIAVRAATGRLGANPVATALNQLGLLALVFLVASLACTPLRIVLGKGWPIRLRKTLGLLAFYAALAHFAVYAFVDRGALGDVVRDVAKRPFIAVGFVAFVLLVPLALTSTKEWQATLGFARWKRMHRLVYPSALLAVVHFTLRVKADATEPLLWGALVVVLLGVRFAVFVRKSPPDGGPEASAGLEQGAGPERAVPPSSRGVGPRWIHSSGEARASPMTSHDGVPVGLCPTDS